VKTFRRIVQIVFLLFFILLFLNARYPYSASPSSALFLRFSPLGPLFDFIAHLHISPLFWPALVILILTPFFGRFFCGWVCPLGTTLDITDRLLKPPPNSLINKWNTLRYFKFALLLALIFLALFGIHLWGYVDPLSLFNRALTVIFYPFATLFTEKVLLTAGNVIPIGGLWDSVYNEFKNMIMPENQAYFQQVFWIALFFFSVLAAEKLSRRFWCRNICPAGALLGFLSQFRFFGRVVADSCPNCRICHHNCKMNAIDYDNPLQTDKVECIQCLSCAQHCPDKVNAISYKWRWKAQRTSVNLDRRRFLQTAGGSLVALGLLNLNLVQAKEQAFLIRPPGALPENEFLNRCIHCLECVRICSSNGGCLQPDQIHFDLRQLWAPAAKMREGYCEYNCNLCGQVCPTQAILPLPLEKKKKTAMGLARFDKNACIPYVQNENCIVCQEHCPVEDKAIKFNVKQVRQKDDSLKEVKYPYVVAELCIGCGICETKCPVPGLPGIYVTTEHQTRLSAI